MLLTLLLSMACSACLLTQHRTTTPGISQHSELVIYTLTINQNDAPTDLHTDQSDSGTFSTQISLTQMISLCVKVIRNSPTQNQDFQSQCCSSSSHLMKQSYYDLIASSFSYISIRT